MPCEEEIKKKSGEEGKKLADQSETALSGAAKSLCIPFEQDELPANCVCFHCKQPAKVWTLFGRSY